MKQRYAIILALLIVTILAQIASALSVNDVFKQLTYNGNEGIAEFTINVTVPKPLPITNFTISQMRNQGSIVAWELQEYKNCTEQIEQPVVTIVSVCRQGEGNVTVCANETRTNYQTSTVTTLKYCPVTEITSGPKTYRLKTTIRSEKKNGVFGYSVDWVPGVVLAGTSYNQGAWAWFNSSWSKSACFNVSANTTVNNRVVEYPLWNASTINLTRTSNIRLTRGDSTEIPFDITNDQKNATAWYVRFIDNQTTSNQLYCVYYANTSVMAGYDYSNCGVWSPCTNASGANGGSLFLKTDMFEGASGRDTTWWTLGGTNHFPAETAKVHQGVQGIGYGSGVDGVAGWLYGPVYNLRNSTMFAEIWTYRHNYTPGVQTAWFFSPFSQPYVALTQPAHYVQFSNASSKFQVHNVSALINSAYAVPSGGWHMVRQTCSNETGRHVLTVNTVMVYNVSRNCTIVGSEIEEGTNYQQYRPYLDEFRISKNNFTSWGTLTYGALVLSAQPVANCECPTSADAYWGGCTINDCNANGRSIYLNGTVRIAGTVTNFKGPFAMPGNRLEILSTGKMTG